MKLLKKLLPIVTCASAAAVTVPLVTSCTGDAKGITVNVFDFLEKGYKRQTEILPATTDIATTDGLDVYLKGINENGNIFADDFFEMLLFVLDEAIVSSTNYNAPTPVNPVLTDIDGTVRIGSATADVEKQTISFDGSLDVYLPFNFMAEVEDGVTILIDVVADANIEFKIKNLAINITYEDEIGPLVTSFGDMIQPWFLYPNYVPYLPFGPTAATNSNALAPRDLKTDEDWGIEIKGKVNATALDTPINLDVDLNLSHNSTEYELMILSLVLSEIATPVMYLRHVVPSNIQ